MKYKVLVTGGSGLVGTGLVLALKHPTYIPYIYGAPPELDINDVQFVWASSKDADLTDEGQTRDLFSKTNPDMVVHLAARVGGLFSNMSANIDFLRQNLKINDNVILMCHEFKIQKAIFCLSTCVFPAAAPLPLKEEYIHDGPPHSSNEGYSVAKRVMECFCRFYREKYGYSWMCIIPTNLYGPGDNFSIGDGHVLPSLIQKCCFAKKNGEVFIIRGSGQPLRQFLYSPDLGRIILSLLTADAKVINDNASLIVCADINEEYSIEHIAREVITAVDFNGEVKFDTNYADGIFKKTASNEKLRKLIGSEFVFTGITEGVFKTVNWFRQNLDSLEQKVRL